MGGYSVFQDADDLMLRQHVSVVQSQQKQLADREGRCASELGETEVAAAREAAKNRNGVQYKIVYVSNVSDPNETRIELLPNPMTDEGASRPKLRGEGIRYRFKRL